MDATREGMTAAESSYLNDTFKYTGVGVFTIGMVAKSLHNMGWSYRLMSMNPWLVVGGSLVASIGTMMATRMTDPDNTFAKHAWWFAFNIAQGATLAPVFFYNPALIARAGLYTVGLMGGISIVGATAKNDQYLWLGAPLLGGVAVVAMSGLAPLVLSPAGRAFAVADKIWLYGGLAVFGGFTLYDIQKIRTRAKWAAEGRIKRDPINESISLELDFLNIFIRMLEILQRRDNKRR